MKKRTHVYFLVFTMSIFSLLISNVVFGASPAEQVIRKYESTLQREDVRSLLPSFLRDFKGSKTQKSMQSHHVDVLLGNPLFLRKLVPGTDDQFIALLYVNKDFRELFGDAQFYNVLKDSGEINKLLNWFKTQPPPSDKICPTPQPASVPEPPSPRATTLRIVSGNDDQSSEVGKPLAQPFVVGVLDQGGKPLRGIAVTFTVTAGGGQLSATRGVTDVYGQARTTLTLGPRAGRNSVVARAVGITQTQTFTATAIAIAPPPPPEVPEPVVPVPPSTEESPLPPIYWIEGNTIYYRPTGGGKAMFNAPQDGTLEGGLVVDAAGGKVYWTERTSNNKGRIRSANLDGTNVQQVNKELLFAVPSNIALDPVGRKLYWTNSIGKIQRIKVGGSFIEDFITGLNAPKHIAFDVKERRLYWMAADGIWSIYTGNDTGIPRPLGKEDLGEVRGIAVADDVVYWTGQTNGLGKVRSMNRTGSGDKLLAVLESTPEGIAVDPESGKVYWTTSGGEIQSAPLAGAIQTVVEGVGKPTGIALGHVSGAATRAAPSAAAPSVSSGGSVENTLLANYPNPFNPETWIPYQLSASADVSISIYSVNGHLVRRLDLGHQVAGVYQSRSRAAYWDGRNAFGERVASGLYFYTLTAGDFTATRKMLIRK